MVKNKIKEQRIDFLLIVYLFLWIFDPPIFYDFSFEIPLFFLSIIYALINQKYAIKILMKSKLFNFLKTYFVFAIYAFLVIGVSFIVSGNNTLYMSFLDVTLSLISYGGFTVSILLFLLIRSEKRNYSYDFIVKTIITVALIQSVFVILAFISPEIKSYFINVMSSNISPDNKLSSYVTDITSKRNYGFAYSLYDMFGYSTSIMFILALNYGIYRNKKYLLLSLPLFMMPLLNTRTGLFLSVIGIILSLFIYLLYSKSTIIFLKIILLSPFIVVFLIIIFQLLKATNPATYLWLNDGISSTIAFIFKGELTGAYFIETSTYWFLPPGVNTIFGTGLTPKHLIQTNSDIGYINIIWKFGIIGLVLVSAIYISTFSKAYKITKDPMKKIVVLFLIVSLVIYMVKSETIKASPGTYLLFILCYAIIFDENSANNRVNRLE
jgi:hypothetical protein